MDYRLENKFQLPVVEDRGMNSIRNQGSNRLTRGEKVYRDEINTKLEEIDRLKKLKARYKTPMKRDPGLSYNKSVDHGRKSPGRAPRYQTA